MVIDGKDYPVVSSDYTLQGKGQGSSTAKKVGVGAVAGTIIGAIAGGGKGAAIGAGVGAGAGAGGAAFTGNKEIVLPAESAVSFKLLQPVEIKM